MTTTFLQKKRIGIHVLLVTITGVFMILDSCLADSGNTASSNSVIRANISAPDEALRLEGQRRAFAEGPNIVGSLRDLDTQEARELVSSYDDLTQKSDKQRALKAIHYFSKNGALRFLTGSLRNIQNKDAKIECVREVAKCDMRALEMELPILVATLEEEPVYESGSEAATLHGMYIQELTMLVAAVTGQEVPSSGTLDKKVDAVVKHAKSRMGGKNGTNSRPVIPPAK